MDGLVLVHTPVLLATVVVIDRGHILLPQEDVVTTLLHQRERKSARQNRQDSQKNMTTIRSWDPVLLVIEVNTMTPIMIPTRGRQHLTILLYQRERKSARQNHQSSQMNMMWIRSVYLLVLIKTTAVMLTMATMSEMTTLLHQRKRENAWQDHQDCPKSMVRIRSRDPIVVMIEVTAVMLIMVSKRVRQQLMVRDHLPTRSHPDHPLDHTQEGEMPTLLPQREKKSVGSNHQDSQKNMINIGSGDQILLMIEMTAVMLIIVTMIAICMSTGSR